MFTLALSLLGGGTALGAVLWFFPVLREAPPKVWLAFCALTLIGALVWWHNTSVKAAYAQGQANERTVRDAAWKGALAKWQEASDAWRNNAETAWRSISTIERQKHDLEVRTVDARARTLLVRGPGASATYCAGPGEGSRTAPGPGGPAAPGGAINDGMANLPAGEPMATVPWFELVEHARVADENRAEVNAWRSFYSRLPDALKVPMPGAVPAP